ncbi:MAG: hypothetical protein ACFHU9_04010 [Fluviicola sp.]
MSTTTTIEQEIQDFIAQQGITGVITNVNHRLNTTSLSLLERKLLSDPQLYAACLYYAFNTENVNITDENGIYNAVLRHLATLVEEFYQNLVVEVLDSKGIDSSDTDMVEDIAQLAMDAPVPITDGEAVAPILALYDKVSEEGPYRRFIIAYLDKTKAEVDRDSVSDKMIESMIDYMKSLNLSIPTATLDVESAINDQDFDEYFALALDYAIKVDQGGIDPIDQIRVKGSKNTWDFSVDLFDSAGEQGILPKNILGAGAVNYIYVLGEQLGVFDLAEALILEWARGSIYITDPVAESRMYRYYKLLEERTSSEERGMLYKRVLNLGDAELLQGTIVNDSFTRLWHALMEEVVAYITKTETSNNQDFVSKLPIVQLIREIQYNLTSFFTGMAHIQTTEMYNHLQDAFEIMSQPGVINQVAPGRTQNVWSVIDMLHQSKFGTSPNITAYKTAAVEGYNLFQIISTFNESTITKTEFTNFIVKCEAYIIALGQEGSKESSDGPVSPRAELAAAEEEFEDWDM